VVEDLEVEKIMRGFGSLGITPPRGANDKLRYDNSSGGSGGSGGAGGAGGAVTEKRESGRVYFSPAVVAIRTGRLGSGLGYGNGFGWVHAFLSWVRASRCVR